MAEDTCPDCGLSADLAREAAATELPDPGDDPHAQHGFPEGKAQVPSGHPEAPVPSEFGDVENRHPWAKIHRCPDCGAGATICENNFHGETPAVYPLPPSNSAGWDRDSLKWQEKLEGGGVPGVPSLAEEWGDDPLGSQYNRPTPQGPTGVGMDALPKTKKKLKELEERGLVYHQTVRDPTSVTKRDPNGDLSVHRHIHDTRADAEAAHAAAEAAGLISQITPVQRHEIERPPTTHELDGRPTNPKGPNKIRGGPGMAPVPELEEQPEKVVRRNDTKIAGHCDDGCPLFDVEAHITDDYHKHNLDAVIIDGERWDPDQPHPYVEPYAYHTCRVCGLEEDEDTHEGHSWDDSTRTGATQIKVADRECPDCGNKWDGDSPKCPSCGLDIDDLEAAGDFYDRMKGTYATLDMADCPDCYGSGDCDCGGADRDHDACENTGKCPTCRGDGYITPNGARVRTSAANWVQPENLNPGDKVLAHFSCNCGLKHKPDVQKLIYQGGREEDGQTYHKFATGEFDSPDPRSNKGDYDFDVYRFNNQDRWGNYWAYGSDADPVRFERHAAETPLREGEDPWAARGPVETQLKGSCIRCGKDVMAGDASDFGGNKWSCSSCAPLVAGNLDQYTKTGSRDTEAESDLVLNYIYDNDWAEWEKIQTKASLDSLDRVSDDGRRESCHECGHVIAPVLGELPYGEVESEGTDRDPCAPGDYNDICDHCYVNGLSPRTSQNIGYCIKCGGDGDDSTGRPCTECGGTGKEGGETRCLACSGSGDAPGGGGLPCTACKGTGRSDLAAHPRAASAERYPLECYSCGKTNKEEDVDFGLGWNRQCPDCGSYEVHHPEARNNWAKKGSESCIHGFNSPEECYNCKNPVQSETDLRGIPNAEPGARGTGMKLRKEDRERLRATGGIANKPQQTEA